MTLLTHPKNRSQGKGGLAFRKVSTQSTFRVETRVVTKEKRLMLKSHAKEKEDHDSVNTEDDSKYRRGSSIGESTEIRVKSQNPGQFACTKGVLVIRSRLQMHMKTVSHMSPMIHTTHKNPLTTMRDPLLDSV